MSTAPETVTAARAAEVLGVSKPTVYEWLRRGLLRGTPPQPASVDADHLVELESIRALIENPDTPSPRYREFHRQQQARTEKVAADA